MAASGALPGLCRLHSPTFSLWKLPLWLPSQVWEREVGRELWEFWERSGKEPTLLFHSLFRFCCLISLNDCLSSLGISSPTWINVRWMDEAETKLWDIFSVQRPCYIRTMQRGGQILMPYRPAGDDFCLPKLLFQKKWVMMTSTSCHGRCWLIPGLYFLSLSVLSIQLYY